VQGRAKIGGGRRKDDENKRTTKRGSDRKFMKAVWAFEWGAGAGKANAFSENRNRWKEGGVPSGVGEQRLKIRSRRRKKSPQL